MASKLFSSNKGYRSLPSILIFIVFINKIIIQVQIRKQILRILSIDAALAVIIQTGNNCYIIQIEIQIIVFKLIGLFRLLPIFAAFYVNIQIIYIIVDDFPDNDFFLLFTHDLDI